MKPAFIVRLAAAATLLGKAGRKSAAAKRSIGNQTATKTATKPKRKP